MKRIIYLIALFPYLASSQVYTEPKFVLAEYFYPVTVVMNSDSTFSGFASTSFDNTALRFVDSIEGKTMIKFKDWKYIKATLIKKATLTAYNKDYLLEPIVRKGDLGKFVLYHPIYKNEAIELYVELGNIGKENAWYHLKKGDENAKMFNLDFRDTNVPFDKRTAKLFKECPSLYDAIMDGSYLSTMDEFKRIMDDYAKCMNQ